MRKFVAQAMKGRINTLGCINHGDTTVSSMSKDASSPESSIPSFSVQSHNWKDILGQLIAGANCIVLYLYGSRVTEGVQFEIDTIRKCGMERRCLAVAEDAEIAAEAAALGFHDV